MCKIITINALLLALDRGLQGIPFAALPVEGGTVVDRFALTITPALSLTDLAPEATPRQQRRTLLAGASHFANGLMPLPMAKQELSRLAALHNDSLVLFDAAFQTRSLLEKSRERPIEILHLATHADFAGQRTEGARIYTGDGELSLAELGRALRRQRPDGGLDDLDLVARRDEHHHRRWLDSSGARLHPRCARGQAARAGQHARPHNHGERGGDHVPAV